MGDITTIGLDLAKSVFQVHAVDEMGSVRLRKRLRRSQILAFFAEIRRASSASKPARRRTIGLVS
jgi:transposase